MSKNNLALAVQGVSKQYIIAHEEKHSTLAEAWVDRVKHPFRKTPREIFNALSDVSFEVKKGDVVGIIGRNGAGKSTLLKILSRITEPTQGQIDLYGRIGSLLEVGTGFHPELTGRENVYLNGAILGMKRREIERQFEAIVDFAEVEKFLDTPVKRYSSGMYVRLAFAVAAHLNPEILIVDEVLAVGDTQFQNKCLGKMKEVSHGEGRTVLFVSHNMGSIVTLCNKVILMQRGRIVEMGATAKVIDTYLTGEGGRTAEIITDPVLRPGQKLKIRSLSLRNEQGKICTDYDRRDQVDLHVNFEVIAPGVGYTVAIQLFHTQHGCIFTSSLIDMDPVASLNRQWEVGSYHARLRLPTANMRAGDYFLKIAATVPKIEFLDELREELTFHLLDTDSPEAKCPEGRLGAILPVLSWEVHNI